MKKTLFFFCLLMAGFWADAQAIPDKNLQQFVLQLNTAKTENDYSNLFKKFTQSHTSEQWQAYYYAAVALYLKNDLLIKKNSIQSVKESIAIAEKYAYGTINSQPNNSEIQILLGLIALQKISLDSSSSVQKELSAISEYLSKAEALSSNNPRLTLLKAKMAQQTNPADKEDSERLYQKASKDFETYKSSDSFAPNWGKQLLKNN
ncbi:hypothetical protein [Chryseobacterium fistulae]|uniref:Uncharacterized protein n=1 Tax=Chryseobacterium fistulae TaxID=2675058 RepID=A0A6N4XLQ3_9FLAO|nr:hypothetical protein [Chryseobacterium fistulae]CAA7386808.1 hypothetical protein CHRY9393_01108 [Chryseobacterium fistulae]